MIKSFDLLNRCALITGCAGLLGKEHALALMEAGASVVATDICKSSLSALEKEINKSKFKGRLFCFSMDVTSDSSVASVAEALAERDIAIDILVNNAAINPTMISSDETTTDRFESYNLSRFERELRVGLTGAMLVSKVFGGKMAERGSGVILNIASDLSVISPDQRLYMKKGLEQHEQPVKPISYSVIKTGLVGLTRYLATYWAESGVRVNALSPGGVFDGQSSSFVDELSQRIPMARMARPSEYRGCVQFLCSDASSYITGQNIVADGGRSVW